MVDFTGLGQIYHTWGSGCTDRIPTVLASFGSAVRYAKTDVGYLWYLSLESRHLAGSRYPVTSFENWVWYRQKLHRSLETPKLIYPHFPTTLGQEAQHVALIILVRIDVGVIEELNEITHLQFGPGISFSWNATSRNYSITLQYGEKVDTLGMRIKWRLWNPILRVLWGT